MSRAEILALKHESRVFGHSSNTVCGFSMLKQVRMYCLAHRELALLFHEPDTGLDHCPRILLSYFRATIGGHGLSLWVWGNARLEDRLEEQPGQPNSPTPPPRRKNRYVTRKARASPRNHHTHMTIKAAAARPKSTLKHLTLK